MNEKQKKGDEALKALMSAQACKVILKETGTSFIARTADGKNVNIETNLSPIEGDEGKVLIYKGRPVFLARPS
ncbi:MAG: hypothetical protein RLZZ283_172 [Candidatus Parcubacteria bacterium]|jgi:hypothetical protein